MATVTHTPVLDYPISPKFFSMGLLNEEFGLRWPPPWPLYGLRTFRSNWTKVEVVQGTYDFSQMDFAMNLMEQDGYEPLALAYGIPPWLSTIQDVQTNIVAYRAYVTALAARYKGRIHYYELWNEPESQGFIGNSSILIDLAMETYQQLKAVDPNIVVVSPAFNITSSLPHATANLMDEFYAGGGANWCDVVAFHSYPQPASSGLPSLVPEILKDRIPVVTSILSSNNVNKPIWCTEAGYNIINHDTNDLNACGAFNVALGLALTDDTAQAYLARYYLLNWLFGSERFYWFAYGNKCTSFLEWDFSSVKSSASAYTQLQEWMVGKTMTNATEDDASGLWIITIKGADAEDVEEYIVWAATTDLYMTIPRMWRVNKVVDLFGKSLPINNRRKDQFLVTSRPCRLYLDKGVQSEVAPFL